MASPVLTLVWGCVIALKQHTKQDLVRPNTQQMLPHFFHDICIWINFRSSRHRIKENHSFKVPEHCPHHISSCWRTQSSCAFPSPPSVTLFAQRSTVLLLTATLPYTLPSHLHMFLTASFPAERISYQSTLFVTISLVDSILKRCSRGVMCWEPLQIHTANERSSKAYYLKQQLSTCYWLWKKTVGHYFLSNLCTCVFKPSQQWKVFSPQ